MAARHNGLRSLNYFPEGAWLLYTDLDADEAIFFVADDKAVSLLRHGFLTRHCPESGQCPSHLEPVSGSRDN